MADNDLRAALEALTAKLEAVLDRVTSTRRFVSVAHAAEYADLSEESVRRLLGRGLLNAYRPVRGKDPDRPA